ncbi:MAG: pilin [Lachnospiraceae bacterium]|nr:pilin [Lachnospiraceae bacterium]
MLLVTGVVLFASGDVAFASNVTFDGVVNPIVGLLNKFVNPLLMLVGAGGSLFCIMLGVKYATAEEPQEREKRKQALKTAIIGFVLIFVLIVALKTSIGPLSQWMNESLKGVNSTPSLNN